MAKELKLKKKSSDKSKSDAKSDKKKIKGDKKEKKVKKAKPEVSSEPIKSLNMVQTDNGYFMEMVIGDDATPVKYVEHTMRRVMNRIRAVLKDAEEG